MRDGRWGVTKTVLFTDLVGSTDLMFRLGVERYNGLQRRHLDELRDVLRFHHGTEVKSIGDGIMAVVDSAAGAVAALVEMNIRTAAQGSAAGVDLRIRSGATIGDVYCHDGDYHGPAVVEAARLAATAAADEILISGALRALAGDRAGHTYERVGLVSLKGLPAPVEVYQVLWMRPAGGEVALSPSVPAMADAGQLPMVGRERERALLLADWDIAKAGERRVVLLAGEPGAGKSRLAAEVARHVFAFGDQILVGRCDPEAGGPFQPFVLALRDYLDRAKVGARAVDLGPLMPRLARLLPEIASGRERDEPSSLGPAQEQLAMFDAIADAVHRIAQDSPLLLVLEDLHWATPETIHLLRHLVGWPREAPLLIIATYRSTETRDSAALGPFVAESSRLHRCRTVPVESLDVDGIAALLAAASAALAPDGGSGPAGAAAELAHLIHEQTAGNPLYATQLLAHLDLDELYSTGSPSVGLPGSLRDLVRQRVAGAGPDVARMLEIAAVAGEQFDPILLEQVDDLDGRFVDAFERAVRSGLVVPVANADEARFVHALVRSTTLDELSTVRLVRVHDRFAERLEERGDAPPSTLAHHAVRAARLGPTHAARAVRTAAAAGDHAMAALEYTEAADWYASALNLLDAASDDSPSARVDLMLRFGIAQRNASQPGFRDTLIACALEAQRAGLSDLQVEASLANTRGTFANALGVDTERVEMLRAALDVVPPGNLSERAKLLSLLAMELCAGRGLPERHALCEEAVQLARQTGDDSTLAFVLTRQDTAILHITTIGERDARSREMLPLALSQPDLSLRFWANYYWMKCGLEIGDMERYAEGLDRGFDISAALRQPELDVFLWRGRAVEALLQGDFDAAERHTLDAYEVATRLNIVDGRQIWTSQMFSIRYVQGRLADFHDVMAARKSPRWLPAYWAGWALVNAELGNREEALDALRVQHDIDFWDYPYALQLIPGIAAAALAAARAGDHELAAYLLPVLDAATGSYIADVCYHYGPVAHHQGVLRASLGEFDAALQRLEAATDDTSRHSMVPWRALALAEIARTLRARGRTGDGRRIEAAIAEARAIADRTGMAGLASLIADPIPLP